MTPTGIGGVPDSMKPAQACRRGHELGRVEQAREEQGEGRAPVHTPLDELEAVHVPLDLPLAPAEAGGRAHGVAVPAQAVGGPPERARSAAASHGRSALGSRSRRTRSYDRRSRPLASLAGTHLCDGPTAATPPMLPGNNPGNSAGRHGPFPTGTAVRSVVRQPLVVDGTSLCARVRRATCEPSRGLQNLHSSVRFRPVPLA